MKKWIILSVVALVLLGVIGGFFFTHSYVEGALVYKHTQTLDLSGKEITQLEKICELKDLKELNVEDTGLTIEEYETLRSALPDCHIRWKVPFQGSYYAPDTASITLTSLSQEDILALNHFSQLSYVDATGCRDYEALAQLQSQHPGCAISYTVDLDGQTLPHNTTELKVTGSSVAQIDSALALLPQLESISISGCADALGLKALSEKYPNCAFTYEISIDGQVFTNETAAMTLAPEALPELEAVLPCFTKLTDVTFTGDAPQAHTLADGYPAIAFHYGFTLLGLKVHTDQDFLDLSGIKLEDTQALEEALPYFHNLAKVDMVNCTLENEAMEALNDRHPETLFVWKVLIGDRYYRTDITYFYPTGSYINLAHQDMSNLKYCTELVVLDLGHFLVSDCSFVENMPKLEYLILAIGPLEDIRPIGTLTELRFLEIFSTNVTDYWPLLNCTKLVNLNIAFSGHGDITPLLQMPWLDHLWLSCNEEVFSDEEKATLAEHLPNTIMVFSSGSATNKGWRNCEGYYSMRDFLGDRYLIA